MNISWMTKSDHVFQEWYFSIKLGHTDHHVMENCCWPHLATFFPIIFMSCLCSHSNFFLWYAKKRCQMWRTTITMTTGKIAPKSGTTILILNTPTISNGCFLAPVSPNWFPCVSNLTLSLSGTCEKVFSLMKVALSRLPTSASMWILPNCTSRVGLVRAAAGPNALMVLICPYRLWRRLSSRRAQRGHGV